MPLGDRTRPSVAVLTQFNFVSARIVVSGPARVEAQTGVLFGTTALESGWFGCPIEYRVPHQLPRRKCPLRCSR